MTVLPYMVFSPFFRKGCLNAAPPRIPLGKADTKNLVKAENSKQLNEIEILPNNKWYEKFSDQWDIGEIAANKKLSDFVEDGLMNYKEGRNFPAQKNVSRLSPHLHFGEISPNQIWYRIEQISDPNYSEKDLSHFKSEIGWRNSPTAFSIIIEIYKVIIYIKNLMSSHGQKTMIILKSGNQVILGTL